MEQTGTDKNNRTLRDSMAFNIIGAIVLLVILFGAIVSTIGYFGFTDAFKTEYATSTYHMADTATALINGDHLDAYLAGVAAEEYRETKENLDVYCERMNVSLVYVIKVDTGDYGRFVSIFNAVNNAVDNSSYTAWELGHKRDTTNDEYRRKYRAMYEQTAPYETVYRIKTTDGQHPHITTMVPVKGSDGKTRSILCIQRPMRELKDATRSYLIRIAVWTAALCVFASVVAAVYIRRRVVKPIRIASDEAVRFAKENTRGESLGSLSKLREINNLARSIDTMETDMVRYIDNLTAATAEKERMGTELSLARTIQENSVPNRFPAFPGRKDFDIYASMNPAKEVGGDFYNFFLIDDDHLALVIGDVSGKGIPGALFMMATNIMISDRTRMGGTPGEVLTAVNHDLCAHNKAGMFVTVWLGVLELSTGKVVFANAGHDDAAVLKNGGAFERYRTQHSLVCAGMDGVRYRNFELTLAPGDKLFLYTDGVPEATDAQNRMFGMERMIEALNANREKSPEEILAGVEGHVAAFTDDAPQFDDLTMLCLHYLGPEKTGARELTVDAKIENLSQVTAFVEETLQAAGCPRKAQMQIDVAVDEVFTNIASYAYSPETGTATVRVETEEDPKAAIITLIDGGKPFDPLSLKEPDVTAPSETRKIGGLGVYLVRKTMDDVRYEYRDGKNILRIKKYF